MPDGLYEHDALAWSEQQAALLRRLAAGERVNAAVDWENVIEEVQDLGLSELHACESFLQQALRHLLKLGLWPDSPAASHWRGETITFLAQARRRYSPSMLRRIDLHDLYRDVRRAVLAESDSPIAASLPDRCCLHLDDLLTAEPELASLVAKLQNQSAQPSPAAR